MRTMIEKILRGYGKSMVLCQNDVQYSVRGFFQAVTGKSEQYAKLQPGIAGLEDLARYVYIGPIQPEAKTGDEIIADEKHYQIRHAQVIYEGAEAVYVWGMCVEKGGMPNWEMNGCKSLQIF